MVEFIIYCCFIFLMIVFVNTVYLIAFYVLVPGLIGAILGWLYGKIVKNP